MNQAKLEKELISLLSNIAFRRMSNLVIFNLTYFGELGSGNRTDDLVRLALKQELYRRSILINPPTFDYACNRGNVDVDKFTGDDMDSVELWFNGDMTGATAEDHYIELMTGRDRWAERNPKRKHPVKKTGKH